MGAQVHLGRPLLAALRRPISCFGTRWSLRDDPGLGWPRPRRRLLAALRAALWKSLGLTAVVLVALWFAVRWLFEAEVIPFVSQFSPDMPAWVDNAGTLAGWAAGVALAFLLAFLIAPVSAVIAGLFLDDVAEVVERDDYPGHAVGRALPLGRSIVLSVKFFGVVISAISSPSRSSWCRWSISAPSS